MATGQYFSIEISVLKATDKHITFDVYLKLSDTNYAHVFSKSTGIDFKRLNSYRDKGVREFYVRNEDKPQYDEFLANRPESIISNPNASNTKKAAALLSLAEQNLSDIFSSLQPQMTLQEEAAEAAKKLVFNFTRVLSKDPKSLALMLKVAAHGDYLYYHSLSVSVVSLFIAKACGVASLRLMEVCGLGGLLHDIGCALLPREILDSPSALTAAQWKEMRQHPHYSVKLIEGIRAIPDEVRFILAQHHEEPRGSGYPAGLRGGVIFFPAKIVALADAFCALTSKRPYRNAYTVEQALNIIKHDSGKWDAELIKILVQIFEQKKPSKAAA